jgi:hypothetical protein
MIGSWRLGLLKQEALWKAELIEARRDFGTCGFDVQNVRQEHGIQ